MEKDSLTHWRTPGSKNGRRRWQNRDGTWTAEGKARRREEYESSKSLDFQKSRNGSYEYNPHYRRDQATNVLFDDGPKGKASLAEKMARATDDSVRSTKQLANGVYDLAGKKKRDLSKMSDDDLRKAINRMNLERSYSSLTDEDKIKGRDKVNSILDIAGGVTGITASATLIAYGIYKIYKETH